MRLAKNWGAGALTVELDSCSWQPAQTSVATACAAAEHAVRGSRLQYAAADDRS